MPGFCSLPPLSGIGQASYHPEGFKTVSLLSGKKKATMFSLFHFGGNLGFGVGPILATFFFVHFGMKGSLLFIIPGVILTVIFLLVPYWKVEAAARPPEGLGWAKGGALPGRVRRP